YGLKFKNKVDLDANSVMTHVQGIVNEIATHHPHEVFEKRGIDIIIGPPEFVDKSSIKVNDKIVTGKKYILCTGSRPAIPPIKGLGEIDYLTNENIFDLKTLPKSLIVLGGGPVGIELSQAMNRLGVDVTIVKRSKGILPKDDVDVVQVLEASLKKEGLKILTGKKTVRFRKTDKGVAVSLESNDGSKQELEAERVLVATGRVPNLEGLGLESAGVKYDKEGLEVNHYLQTTNPNIFACGDIASKYKFSHVAAYQASVSVRNALFKRVAWSKVDYSNVAWATFTDPEIAHLGQTEEEVFKSGKKYKVYTNDYTGSDRAVTDIEKEGFVKIITDKKGILLGAHIAGANAGEVIQGFLIAKSLKIPVTKLAQVMYIYPTLSELVKKTAAKPLFEKMDNPLIKFLLKALRKK
ncbi:MAG: FAD-dependent oxidoreductase, partial [Candidatus Omnitrophica bacterium]|nr:FAD-dependent oxidoreductase [Candidatus Omnitrophota bacterium]